jgi:hypothetical protein
MKNIETTNPNETATEDWIKKTEAELLELVYKYASNGLRVGKSKQAREWLQKKKLSMENTMACFNSGQLHHRKEKEFKEALERIGFMKVSNHASNCESLPYTVFGNFSIMFPLKNKQNEIVNFYAMGIKNNKTSYLNHEGFYPACPHEQTKRLFITDNILDAATILESKVLDNKEAVIALHDGIFLKQHEELIRELKGLTEIIQITSRRK